MAGLQLAVAKLVTGPVSGQILCPEASGDHPGHHYTFVAFKAVASGGSPERMGLAQVTVERKKQVEGIQT